MLKKTVSKWSNNQSQEELLQQKLERGDFKVNEIYLKGEIFQAITCFLCVSYSWNAKSQNIIFTIFQSSVFLFSFDQLLTSLTYDLHILSPALITIGLHANKQRIGPMSL